MKVEGLPVIEVDVIAETLAEVLRDLMRATAVQIDPTDAIVRATEHWEFVSKLLALRGTYLLAHAIW